MTKGIQQFPLLMHRSTGSEDYSRCLDRCRDTKRQDARFVQLRVERKEVLHGLILAVGESSRDGLEFVPSVSLISVSRAIVDEIEAVTHRNS